MANEIYDNTWWGVALDTAPSIGTKPDLFGSQFKMLTSEQDDLVTNGDFATDSDWDKNQATISNGQANISTDGSYASIIQYNVSEIGKNYFYSIDIKSITGTLQLRLGTGTDVDINTVGVKTGYITATQSFLEIKRKSGEGFLNVTIDNVSVQLVRAEEVEAKKCLADWIHRTALQELNN